MTTIHTLVFLTTLFAGGGPPTPATAPTAADVFGEIEARYRRGAIDADRYHFYRVAAIRAPEQLPADLRALLGHAVLRSGTGVLVEAMQHVIRTGDWGGDIHRLLQPPPDLTFTLESTQWPIRVSYGAANQAGYAQAILDAADLSWTVQIGDFGFYQPVMEPGFEPYRFYVEDAGQGTAVYTAPYETNPATSYASCFSYIVIDPNLGSDVGPTVAHEANHSMQLSMDCIEQRTFLENTAVFIEGLTHPDFFASTLWFIPYFQAQPWRALDYFESGSGYPYGGVLWLHYLADKLAVADAGIFARELWEASMQDSDFINEPDYFDAIETVAAAYGADATSMESLYADFAEARYFVGSQDDGQHITGADVFDAEPAVGLRHSVEDLPVVERQPPSEQRPATFGTNYVRVDVTADWSWPVSVRFDGDDTSRWAVRVVLWGEGLTTVSETMTLDPVTRTGAVTVNPAGYDEILMVVANLGDESYDPDDSGYPLASYYYSLEPVLDPAVVTAIVPAAVKRGQQNLHMRLIGENFVYGPEFEVRFNDPMLQVVSIDSFSSSQVMFTLTVPAGASLGPYDVTLVNSGGQEATGEGLVTVVDELDTPDPGPKPKGCQTGAAPGPTSLLLVLLLLAALRRRHLS
jgi:uncharacterized protein (TIGR03382 family)